MLFKQPATTFSPGKQHSIRIGMACASLLLMAGCTTAPTSPDGSSQPRLEIPAGSLPARIPPGDPVQRVTTAEENTLRNLVAAQDRLYRIAAPLLISNASLCKGGARNLLGFTAKTRHSYSAEFVNAAQTVLGLDDRLQVTGVLDGSSAARAGMRRGDVLLAVEGNAMPEGPDAERRAAALLGPLVSKKSVLQLTVARNGRETAVNVPLTLACAYGIELGNVNSVNSLADGRRILLTQGMMDFVRNDQELAYVIAREMAHNALAHAQRQRQAPAMSALIDDLIRLKPAAAASTGNGGVKPMSQAFDLAADRVALYMLARAGYPIDSALPFWKRLAEEYPATIANGHTALHPATKPRWQVIERTISIIKNKQALRKPLVP